MSNKINECIQGREGSYIMPFMWVHGESHSRLEEEIDAIYRSGLKEFCVESRTHEKFCEEEWWSDFAFILEQAKKRDMYVWLLDDKHFPTGYANGAIQKKYPHLRKKNVRIECIDVAGPVIGSAFIADRFDKNSEELISVSAFRRTGTDDYVDGSTGVLLTRNVSNGLVFWDVPEGVWRLFFVIRTNRGPAHCNHYIDMCDAKSCKVMISEIYQPHYERFGSYFGNTFKGFFSDEPCFANNIGSYYDKLGTTTLVLPWRNDMISLLSDRANLSLEDTELLLPSLWYTLEGKTSLMRLAYMDVITCLYRDNFSNMLGDWCRERNVMYIGHVIEDMNAHMRTGYGSGHFFRALEGQDMSGMDIVLHQIIPGITNMKNTCSTSGRFADPDFYLNTVAKLAQSASHIDPKKKGRAMCELYGAYGWAEGLPTMKYLTDLMLVNGINHYVPHAFTAKDKDPDCPPHFYAGGQNPQYPMFRHLMNYMQKACHILNGGTHCANAVVFYNAEGEWSGGKNRLFQEVTTNLLRNQIDFDFIPADIFLSGSYLIKDKKLVVNEESYDALVVSYSEVFPKNLLEAFNKLTEEGFTVIFTDALPDRTEDNWSDEAELECLKAETAKLCDNFVVCPYDRVAEYFKVNGFADIKLDGDYPEVRFTHLKNEDNNIYYFFNLSVSDTVDTNVSNLDMSDEYYEYDIWNNKVYKCETSDKGLRLHLLPGHATVIFTSEEEIDSEKANYDTEFMLIEGITFDVSLNENGNVTYLGTMDSLSLKNLAPGFPTFCGTVRYEGKINSSTKVKSIDLGTVGEIAQLWVNGADCGIMIYPPYVFDVSQHWVNGENTIVIEVTTNPGYRERDYFSNFLHLPPTGLIGPLKISL